MKNNLLKITAFVMAVILIFMSLSACKKKSEEKEKPKKATSSQSSDENKNEENSNNSDTVSENDTVSTPSFNIPDINWDDGPTYDDDTEYVPVFNVEDMFDGDTTTYWSPYKTETSSVEFSLKKEKTFNTVIFTEYRSYITDYILEAKQSGKWVQIYRQDEMGKRTGVLDKTFTAKDFRLTLTLSDERGGIAEIDFALEEGLVSKDSFSNVGYYTASRLERIRANNYAELKGLTDIILFDFGSWDKNGDFLWGSMNSLYDEEFLEEMLKESEEVLNGRPIRIWFSLQNYNKASTADTAELFATAEARNKLADFAVSLCEKYGFYGIDIDYEYPQYSKTAPDTAWANYDKFLKTAADKLHAKGYKLSAAMAPARVSLSKETVKAIDKVNIMAYDILDSNGKHSSYALVSRSVTYFTDLGFEKSQLVMGLPYYTKTTTNQGGQPWYWVINRWRNAVKPWVNSAYTNKNVFYFNGPYLIRDKVFYSMKQELGGVFCWCMGCDIPQSDSRSLSLVTKETIERFTK